MDVATTQLDTSPAQSQNKANRTSSMIASVSMFTFFPYSSLTIHSYRLYGHARNRNWFWKNIITETSNATIFRCRQQ
jgi:hypothetical protein